MRIRSVLGRRTVLWAAALALAAPLARIAALRLQNAPMRRVAEPDLRIVDGWVLDADDLRADRAE